MSIIDIPYETILSDDTIYYRCKVIKERLLRNYKCRVEEKSGDIAYLEACPKRKRKRSSCFTSHQETLVMVVKFILTKDIPNLLEEAQKFIISPHCPYSTLQSHPNYHWMVKVGESGDLSNELVCFESSLECQKGSYLEVNIFKTDLSFYETNATTLENLLGRYAEKNKSLERIKLMIEKEQTLFKLTIHQE